MLAEAGIVGFAVLLVLPVVIYVIVKRRERRATERSSE